jgi:hypothetical protein
MKSLVKTLFVLIVLVSGTLFKVHAQDAAAPLTIADPGELYSTYDFTATDSSTLVASLGAAKFKSIKNAHREEQWPSGISNLDARNQNRELVKQYHYTLVTTLNQMSIIELKPSDNKHMPANMQSVSSFYFVIGSGGLVKSNENSDALASGNNAIDSGNNEEAYNEDEFPQVLIVDPGQIFPNYEFSEQEAQSIKDLVGAEGFDYINARCREDSFPAGINTEEKRVNAAEEMESYNAFLIVETDDFSIIEITPEENPQMSPELLPTSVFYFVISPDGIEVLDY